MNNTLMTGFLEMFWEMKKRGGSALEQLSPDQLSWQPNANSNSVAVIVGHLHGNMRSRWTDFLTGDGEKSWRDRDAEFELEPAAEQVLTLWEEGWATVFAALEPLTDADLEKKILIRERELSVFTAIVRQIDHYGGHIGQIVYLAKWMKGPDWKTLSIARGESKNYVPHSSWLEGQKE